MSDEVRWASWNLTTATLQLIATKALPSFSNAFFYRSSEGFNFFAPAEGDNIKHTENSTYARTELRETLANGDDDGADWLIDSYPVHILKSGPICIKKLAASGKAIIGQFHGQGENPIFKFNVTLEKGSTDTFTLWAQCRVKLGGSETKIALATGLKLGQWYEGYEVWMFADAHALFFWENQQVVNDKLPQKGFQFDAKSYANDKQYGKAGMYSQEKLPGKGAGWIIFRTMPTLYHGPVPDKLPGQSVSTLPETAIPTDPIDQVTKLLNDIESNIEADLAGGSMTSAKERTFKVQLQSVTDQLDNINDKARTPLYTRIKTLLKKL